jgi:SAM-dependent methyltransferase
MPDPFDSRATRGPLTVHSRKPGTDTMPVVPRRSLRWRGFGVTVELPERIGRAFRRLRPKHATPPDELVVSAPPTISTASREAERVAVSDFAMEASASSNAKADAIADDISDHPWYHTIELRDGVVTSGRFDHRPLVPHYGLPEDLRGKRALDVGSGDGFWAFELERRGAEVTSVDVETFADVDLPPALHEIFRQRPVDLSFRRGIDIARRQLGSNVKLVNSSVYDLDPDRVGTFDFVHTGDILLHLRDPALALQRLRAVTSGTALVADVFDPSLDALRAGPWLTRYRGGWSDVTWWAPALSTLVQMVADAGFVNVEVLTTYRLTNRGSSVPGPWRAVLRGRV